MAVAPTTRRVQRSQVPVMAHARAVWNPQPRLELAFVRALVYACIQIGSVELVDELSADLWKGCEQIRKVRTAGWWLERGAVRGGWGHHVLAHLVTYVTCATHATYATGTRGRFLRCGQHPKVCTRARDASARPQL